MKVKVTVTPLDIVGGQPGEPCSCPIALAIRRALPGSDPFVSPEDVGIDWDDKIANYHILLDLPPAAKDFIDRYDSNQPVDPFEFELDYEVAS